MRKELTQLLGKNYTITGSDRKLEVTDSRVLGYNTERNVAQVEVRGGKIMVNVYRGRFYKPTEFVEVKSLGEIKSLVEGRFKAREGNKEKGNGQDV